MTTEAQKRANARYYFKNKDDVKVIALRLRKSKDADVIAILDSVPNKLSYIKGLIRKDNL